MAQPSPAGRRQRMRLLSAKTPRSNVKRSNRHRLIGLTRPDIWLKRRKVAVMRRLVRQIGTGSGCRGIPVRVPEPTAVEALKGADIIIGCVDNLHARLDLQDLAWRFLIPYVDIGVSIRPVEDAQDASPRVVIGGNVITLIPGGFCLWCCGFLSEEKLAWELAGPNRSYFQNKMGEAQVVSLNGIIASQAVSEVLQLLTGFAWSGIRRAEVGVDPHGADQRGFKKLNGTRGTLQEGGHPTVGVHTLSHNTCTRCSQLVRSTCKLFSIARGHSLVGTVDMGPDTIQCLISRIVNCTPVVGLKVAKPKISAKSCFPHVQGGLVCSNEFCPVAAI
jgi:hypothetical protein